MAFFLFSGLGARGHLHPLVAVAKVLQANGHRIAFYTSTHYRQMVENLNFEFLPPLEWKDFDFARMEEYWPELAPTDNAKRSVPIYFKVFMGTATGQAQDLLHYSETLKPDVLVTEPHAFGTQIISPKTNLPWAMLGLALGVVPLPILGPRGMPLMNHPYLYLSQGLREFDKNKKVLPQTHYIGACNWDEGFAQPVTLPETTLPLVCVSLGTIFARAEFFQKVIEASTNQPWHALISTSSRVDPASLGKLPANVTAVPYIPYSQIMPGVAAMLNHAGGGPILSALSHGVPLVVAPIEADHPANADRLVESGAALRLNFAECTPAEIREAINRVISEPDFRINAQALQQALAQAGGAQKAATLLEQLAETKQPLS